MFPKLQVRDVFKLNGAGKYLFLALKNGIFYAVNLENNERFKHRLSTLKNQTVTKVEPNPLPMGMHKWSKDLLKAIIAVEKDCVSAKDPALACNADPLQEILASKGPKSKLFLDSWTIWRKLLAERAYDKVEIVKSRRIIKAIKRREYLASSIRSRTPAVLSVTPSPTYAVKPSEIDGYGRKAPYKWYPEQVTIVPGRDRLDFNTIEANLLAHPGRNGQFLTWFETAYPRGATRRTPSTNTLIHVWFNGGIGDIDDLSIEARGYYDEAKGPGYYSRDSFMKFPFPKWASWELPFWPVARTSEKIHKVDPYELMAYTGRVNRKGQQFRWWFHYLKSKPPGCNRHNSINHNCMKCAKKIYKEWYDGLY